MKSIFILTILAALLGGCAIVPVGYRDGRDDHYRGHDEYYRDRDHARGNDGYWNRDDRYRNDRGYRDSRTPPFRDQGS